MVVHSAVNAMPPPAVPTEPPLPLPRPAVSYTAPSPFAGDFYGAVTGIVLSTISNAGHVTNNNRYGIYLRDGGLLTNTGCNRKMPGAAMSGLIRIHQYAPFGKCLIGRPMPTEPFFMRN
jgi:hypothetical protein